MAEMTIEQQQALAMAQARRLRAEAEAKGANQDGSLSVDNSVRSLATGVPIVGGALDRLDAATNATLAPLIDPLLPDSFQKLPGETWEDRYSQALDIQKGKDAAFHEEHPYVDTGLNVAGGVAGTIPAIIAAPAAFGAGGGGLLLRSGISAATGGAMGGADAAVRSDGDLRDMAWGAGAGLGFGLIGPSVGKAVGAGARAVMDKWRNSAAAKVANINPEAFTFLRRAVRDDGLDAARVQQRFTEMGPDAMFADLGPNLQKQAGALAATPGREQEIVRTALADRQAGANARIAQTIDETTGRNVVPSVIEADISANQQAHSPLYRQAFSEARPYNTEPIASALEVDINRLRGPAQARLRQVRGMLNIADSNVLSTDPNVMFQTRQAIDGILKTEIDPKVITALTEARQMIDDGLTRAVPRIKEIDAGYAELARQNEAVTRGQQVLDSGRTAPRPSELVAEVEQGVQPQGMQIGPSAVPLRLSQGARAEIDRIVGTNSNDIVAMNRLIKGEGDWNRARLATLFGPEKAERLFKVLENERVFADTANTVTRNSETAARLAAQNELGGAGGGGFGLKESFKAGGVRGAARSFVMDKVEDIAKALLPDGSAAARESLASALVDRQRDSLANVVRALAASGNIGKTPALVDPVVKALLLTNGSAGTR